MNALGTVAALVAQAAAPNDPSLAVALARAGAFCEAALETGHRAVPDGTELFLADASLIGKDKPILPIPKSVTRRPLATVPPLIARFIPTVSYHVAADLGFALRFPSSGGSVWAFPAEGYSACDVMVTDAADMQALAPGFIDASQRDGWTVVRRVDASSTAPLARQLLLKRHPTTESPANGIQLKVSWLAAPAAARDGVQVEISYIAGDVPASVISKQ